MAVIEAQVSFDCYFIYDYLLFDMKHFVGLTKVISCWIKAGALLTHYIRLIVYQFDHAYLLNDLLLPEVPVGQYSEQCNGSVAVAILQILGEIRRINEKDISFHTFWGLALFRNFVFDTFIHFSRFNIKQLSGSGRSRPVFNTINTGNSSGAGFAFACTDTVATSKMRPMYLYGI